MHPFSGSILLTHLHWDHTQGLPFCPSIDRDDACVELWIPTQIGPLAAEQPVDVLARAMSPPHFPIAPSELRGRWAFRPFDIGTQTIEGLRSPSRRSPTRAAVRSAFASLTAPDHHLHAGSWSDRSRPGAERLG